MDKLPLEINVSNPTHGLICMANTASFSNTHFSEPLTTYAQGWRDPSDLQGFLDFLFPPVRVGRRFEFRRHNDSSDFMYDTDDARAPGADFKRVRYTGDIQQSKTTNRGLTVFVDEDEVGGDPGWQEVYTGRLLRRSIRNDLVSACSMLVAACDNSAKTWGAESDPDTDILNLVEGAGDTLGFNPSRLAFFGASWTKRVGALRGKNTAGAFASLGLTTADQVAQYAGALHGKVVNFRVQSSAGKGKVSGNTVVAFHAEDGIGPDDPSHTKRFWSPCGDGTQYRVYLRQHSEKLWALTVERYVQLVVTSTVGLKKLTIS